VNKLIEEKKRFTVIPYPNRTHSMREGKNTQYHLYDTYLWYFMEHLMPDK
jgi:dipeptidyl-peptidase-4